ncbi:MAG TPA: DUF488 domain-containing protein [Candidatus Acidoferrales bacterium]|nr:DUF488 domain-containing protein [Candidatus Acidoferrales bacterium]
MLTIGHSTRTIEEFLEILRAHGVEVLADIRTVPKSRHNPQFHRDALEPALAAAGIRYVHMPGLGGLRHARKDSINTGWRNASFRGYADYMQTPEFAQHLAGLIAIEKEGRTAAMMCAEAVPWRCHRTLVADALLIRGVGTAHIMSATKTNPHTLTPFAKVKGSKLWYPDDDEKEE